MYKNLGDGTFSDVTGIFSAQEDGSPFTFVSVPIDVNDDGWLDIYSANDFGRNDLYINQNGNGFVEQSAAFNLDNESTGMGLSIGDYNNDGSFEMYLSNINFNAFFVSDGNESYIDLASEKGVLNGGWAWDSRFADFDLDGDEDLLVLNGSINSYNYNIFFKNLLKEGEDSFIDATEEVNLNEFTSSLSSAVFDYDNDGDLDLYVTNFETSSFFYENKIQSEDENLHWFKVGLSGTISNRDGIGTTVSITTNSGTYHRFYHGSGLYTQSLQPVHFGIGQDDKILELKISWPLGLEETYTNLDGNTTILATEGQGYEVLTDDPSTKISGCTDPNSCNYNSLATDDDGSCTYLESKGIVGNSSSFFLKTEVYSYPLSEGGQINWHVEGGEIIERIGDNAIKVKWGLQVEGIIEAVEINGCSSLPSELIISLEPSSNSNDNNHSAARLWNEVLLQAIRGDYARPTVHARNLFHTSICMYDAWAIHDNQARPYLIGNELHNFTSEFKDFVPVEPIEESRIKAVSYAAYRLLTHRFKNSPSAVETQERFDMLMQSLGYDISETSQNYESGDAAALGNYIGATLINYGYSDGANETGIYENIYYQPVNPPLAPVEAGSGGLLDPNRWQPLSLDVFIDQSGNLISETTPDFLSPEWGDVSPFSLGEEVKTTHLRNGNTFTMYHDPGSPPNLNITSTTVESDAYIWGNTLVSIWASHLDPTDEVIWDISPQFIGNINSDLFPTSYEDYPNFYDLLNGGDISIGHQENPVTNAPYLEQLVPRGDYTRVLAEFWADGPDSETPPGHWFTLLNYVNDHPLTQKKLGGTGATLDALEWDVKSYFIMGGTMHDAAIVAWSIKGWYDYIRPISAIRFIAEKGQSSDVSKPNYDIAGIPLTPGYVEIVEAGDELEGRIGQHIGKIKLYTWKGHNSIGDREVDQAGVGWILAENWWPYQRPSFVTPPFAGFVSGHSTYSRAAAEVMTLLTGDAFFPGGFGEFIAIKNEFLVFEEGPSVDVKLQWATYRDASDQCSLSRIWGGIHPPADDIPGRLIGEKLGVNSFNFAVPYFEGKISELPTEEENKVVFPNPVTFGEVFVSNTEELDRFNLYDSKGSKLEIIDKEYNASTGVTLLKISRGIATGIYFLSINDKSRIIFID